MKSVRLSDYIEIADKTLGAGGLEVEVEGWWIRLKLPLNQWPKPLLTRWEQELHYLFAPATRVGRLDARDCLTLCHLVNPCGEKSGQMEENPHCVHYNRGICVLATTVANDLHPLSFGTIGAFNGISKQRVQQIYAVAQRKVIRAASRDPILREYYSVLGLRPENMPDPAKLAHGIEQLLGD